MVARLLWFFAALLALGCARLGEGTGGDAALPNRGVIPYAPIAVGEAASPWVLRSDDDATRLLHPTAAQGLDGVVLLVEQRHEAEDGIITAFIARADGRADGRAFGDPRPWLQPGDDHPWAHGRFGAPGLHCDGAGCLLAFEAGDGAALALAVGASLDDLAAPAEPLLRPAEPWEAGAVRAPSVVRDGDDVLLFYEAWPADGPPVVARARVRDGQVEAREVLLGPGVDCVDPLGEAEPCWDERGLLGPEARLAFTATGRPVWRLFYTGLGPDRAVDVGFAASWDGVAWRRFAFNPVLAEGDVERDPTNLLLGDRYALYFTLRRGSEEGIAAAFNPPHASDLEAAGRAPVQPPPGPPSEIF